MKITFCGHREIEDIEKVGEWLENTIKALISKGADTFYLGGYGQFDDLAANVLRKFKKQYPEISLILVVPYPGRTAEGYDKIIYPDMTDVAPRLAIIKRNEWMVEASDIVVAYVARDTGGAAKTLRYAQKLFKDVIRYS